MTHNSDVDIYIIQKTHYKVWPAKQKEHPQTHMKWIWEQDNYYKLVGKGFCTGDAQIKLNTQKSDRMLVTYQDFHS
jgi:hypothetical protein